MKSEGLTLGFFGTGDMAVNGSAWLSDVAYELLEKYTYSRIAETDEIRWIFVLTSDEFTQTLADLAFSAKDTKIPYEVITRPDDEISAYAEIAHGAAEQYEVEDPLSQLEARLVEAGQSSLIVLWHDRREKELGMIVAGFVEVGIEVRDSTNGMARIRIEEKSRRDDDYERSIDYTHKWIKDFLLSLDPGSIVAGGARSPVEQWRHRDGSLLDEEEIEIAEIFPDEDVLHISAPLVHDADQAETDARNVEEFKNLIMPLGMQMGTVHFWEIIPMLSEPQRSRAMALSEALELRWPGRSAR